MMAPKIQLMIFLINFVSESSCIIDALYDAGEKVLEFYSTLDELNLTCIGNSRRVKQFFHNNYDNGVNKKIRDQMYEIHVKLHEIEDSTNPKIMNNLIKITESAVMSLKCVDRIDILVTSIADDYKKFCQIIFQNGHIHNHPHDYLKTFPDIESSIEIIRKIMISPKELLLGEPSLISAIIDHAKTQYKVICNIYQSIDEILIDLFKMVIISEMKASLMRPFADSRECIENQEWKRENNFLKTQFQKYFGTYMNIMQENLKLTTGLYMRACDPEDGAWILNKNYYDFVGIVQAMIFGYQPTKCPSESCHKIWQDRTTCDAKYYDNRSGCSNTPIGCEKLGVVQACVLKHGPHKFKYVNSTKLGFFGNNSECREDDGYMIDNTKGSDSAYATCGCHCDRNNNKISFMIMESRGDSNKTVITGLRFKRRNNILFIQPRVGELMANGHIRMHSESWLQIPNDIDASQIHPVDRKNSVFFLDDVLLPPKFVLTGVRFNKVTRENVSGFAIEIFGVPFDYRSGQLDFGGRIQISSSRENLGEEVIFDPISSLQTKKHNIPSSTDLKYVHLQQSFLRNDFGQSMLPQFDAVPFMTDPPSALSGIGIFHKGVKGYAGFISLRAYGMKYGEYFENFISAQTIESREQLFT